MESLSKIINAVKNDTSSTAIFVATVVVTFTVCYFFMGRDRKIPPKAKEVEDPRNFTLDQLKATLEACPKNAYYRPGTIQSFRGQKEMTMMGVEEEKPIYVALQGEVYDVTEGKDFYGPDGPYGSFAGHDVSRAFALGSLDEKDLDQDISDLTYSQKESLAGWIEKYKYYKQYPVVGRLIRPPSGLELTEKELRNHNGTQKVPEGYVDAPIYIAIRRTVYDMSFGGKGFYGPGGPYHFLAGRDGTRSLAKMSFDKADAESRQLDDLEPKHFKTLDDWEDKFRKMRKYPIVGRLID